MRSNLMTSTIAVSPASGRYDAPCTHSLVECGSVRQADTELLPAGGSTASSTVRNTAQVESLTEQVPSLTLSLTLLPSAHTHDQLR